MPPPLLIFVHIPKTAGTTLSRAIRLRLACWPPAHWFKHQRTLGYYGLGYSNTQDLERRFQRIAALSPPRRPQVRFFAAHAGVTLRDRLPQPARTITILREPVARVISTWRYLRQVSAIDPASTLADFALSRQQVHPFFVDNAQVRYLGVQAGRFIDGPPGTCPPEALERAIARVDHDLFFSGLTERFDESVLLLCRSLGWRPLHYARTRVSKAPPPDQPPLHVLDAIRERNALDVALYQHARSRFEAMVDDAGPSLQQELRRYRARNRLVHPLIAPLVAAAPLVRGKR